MTHDLATTAQREEMVAKAAKAVLPVQAIEPVYVFGTDLAGHHDRYGAEFAVSAHGAETGVASGVTGNAYAIPYRDGAGELLPLKAVANHTVHLIEYARERRDTVFRIERFGCEAGEHGDAAMAHLFALAPANCQLPGVWLRHLEAKRCARILLFDPNSRLKDEAWMLQLRRYFSLSAPVWNVPIVEIVTFGSPRSIVSNEVVTKQLGFKHRVIGTNEAYYGEHAGRAAERTAVWYATHFLSICDLLQTIQPIQMRVARLAIGAGLVMEQIDWTPGS